MQTEAQAMPPGCAGVRRQGMALTECVAAAGKVLHLPRGKLEGAGDQNG